MKNSTRFFRALMVLAVILLLFLAWLVLLKVLLAWIAKRRDFVNRWIVDHRIILHVVSLTLLGLILCSAARTRKRRGDDQSKPLDPP